ncbi:hypothetical protein NVP1208B_22 [Vibrio phage 1.208.B._10N.222.52.A7]|nr:hypothetical protein NVP1208B_22 [Vibrio phage 1.208.B._10N.222.52.A7]
MRYVPTSPRSVPEIRAELDKIAEAIDTMLDREGTGPNQMDAPLDMNGQPILNADLSSTAVMVLSQKEEFTLTSGQTTVNTTLSTDTAVFYINGASTDNGRMFEGIDYTVTGANQIELTVPYPVGSSLLMTFTDLENASNMINGGVY